MELLLQLHGSFIGVTALSLVMTLKHEVRDETFKIVALMAVQYPRENVLVAALTALWLMTLLTATTGLVLPRVLPPVLTYQFWNALTAELANENMATAIVAPVQHSQMALPAPLATHGTRRFKRSSTGSLSDIPSARSLSGSIVEGQDPENDDSATPSRSGSHVVLGGERRQSKPDGLLSAAPMIDERADTRAERPSQHHLRRSTRRSSHRGSRRSSRSSTLAAVSSTDAADVLSGTVHLLANAMSDLYGAVAAQSVALADLARDCAARLTPREVRRIAGQATRRQLSSSWNRLRDRLASALMELEHESGYRLRESLKEAWAAVRSAFTLEFLEVFLLIALAECGDQSQIVVSELSAHNNLAGVIFGGMLAHAITSAVAVQIGAFVASCMPPEAVSLVGLGIIFVSSLHNFL